MPLSTREFLRHTVVMVAFRGEKSIRQAPEQFADFKIGVTTRIPLEILAHFGDLFDWALSMAEGQTKWRDSAFLTWDEQVTRFFDTVKKFDDYLASGSQINAPLDKLFQGLVSDALQHIGQINLLRRLAEAPIRGENYFKAEIETGKVGADQSNKRLNLIDPLFKFKEPAK